MSRRRLTQEEIDLWRRVVERAEALHPEKVPQPLPLPKPKPGKPARHRATTGAPIRHSSAKAAAGAPAAGGPTAPVPHMNRRIFDRMKRGRLAPEARLDLHGMTMDHAHPALVRFVLSAQASGKRLVLVITGKGRAREDSGPIPAPHGVLRRQVPFWLSSPPLTQAVLQVAPAHISHGGSGAYYVYLRKPR